MGKWVEMVWLASGCRAGIAVEEVNGIEEELTHHDNLLSTTSSSSLTHTISPLDSSCGG